MATILVVDDRPLNRQYLVTLLGYAGHEVVEANDGVEALDLMQHHATSLVISDVLMPRMDGVELARRIAANNDGSRIPVILYTATHRVSEIQMLAASCGVRTVLAKPSEPQVLLDAVQTELGLPKFSVNAGSGPAATLEPPPVTWRIQQGYLNDLTELRKSLPPGPQNEDEDSTAGIGAGHSERSFLSAQTLSMRLAAVIELRLNLTAQQTPELVLEQFCRAARDILSARIAVICILDEAGQIRELASSGLAPTELAALRSELVPTAGLFGELLRDGVPRRQRVPDDKPALPPNHPRITNLLAARISTAQRTHGWFYVADRLGLAEFPLIDEQLAPTLAAQIASEYESRLLLDQVQRHSALLQLEIDERRNASDRLRESELRFRQLAENIREVFFLNDNATGKTLYVSPAYTEVWQRRVEDLYERPRAWIDAVHPDDRERIAAFFASGVAAGGFDFDYRIVRPDTTVRWIHTRGFPIRDADGNVYRTAGLAEDITEKKLQELSIQRLSRIHRVLSGINSAIVRIHDRDALLDEACRIVVEEGGFPIAWIALLDSEKEGVVRAVAARGIDAATVAALNDYLAADASRQWEPAQRTVQSRRPVVVRDLRQSIDANAGPVSRQAVERGYRSLISLPLLPNGELAGVLLIHAQETDFFDDQELALLEELAGDVSFALQYIAKEERLSYLAYYDPMTGLPNTALLRERLSQVVRQQQRGSAALFIVDLDRFAQVNDSLGRHVGDRLLTSVGKRLQLAAPEGSTVGRIGADSFAIVVASLRNDTETGLILQEKILGAINKPFVIDGTELRTTARAGVAVYPADGTDAETLLKNAEAALKEAKATGARFRYYSPELNARVAEDLALEQQLLTALERSEFVVYYQPIVAAMGGRLVGVEALIRWRNSKGVLVPPDRFIRVLEETELILDVGRWVLERALADYKVWLDKGLRPPRVAVNVSPIQLRYADFPDMVIGAIERCGIDGSALELEITESVIMSDIASNTERLQRISDRGVSVAIDDFGTGYSSLRYLAKLPVDTLKIDRSFIVSMATDSDSMTLVSTVVSLAHAFELKVVAEGVDAEDQAHLLRLMKCDYLQGYLFAKPMPADQIEKLLAEQG